MLEYFRIGKVKPLDLLEKDQTGKYINVFISLGDLNGNTEFNVASEFVCHIYGQRKTQNVNEAQYNKLIQMADNH